MSMTQTDLDHFYQFAKSKIAKEGGKLTLASLVAMYDQGRKFDDTVSSITADIDEEQMRRYRARDEPDDQQKQF